MTTDNLGPFRRSNPNSKVNRSLDRLNKFGRLKNVGPNKNNVPRREISAIHAVNPDANSHLDQDYKSIGPHLINSTSEYNIDPNLIPVSKNDYFSPLYSPMLQPLPVSTKPV
jgi:hypothetical protein